MGDLSGQKRLENGSGVGDPHQINPSRYDVDVTVSPVTDVDDRMPA
jgi:hypothetical protein